MSAFLSSSVALVAALLLLDSLHFVFARLLYARIAPGISVMYVLAISTVEVGFFGFLRGRLGKGKGIDTGAAKRHFGFFLAIGVLIAVSTAVNYEAVGYIDPGTASLLSQSSVLFSLGFGVFWLRDRLNTAQLIGAGLALLGVFVIAFQPGDYLRLGALLVVGSALMYAFHAALTKRYSGEIDLLDFFFYRLLFTTAVLAVLAVVRGKVIWPDGGTWALILLVGTVDVVLSRALYYLALRRLTMSLHTIALTLSPVAAISWALLLFGTFPRPQQVLGGMAVIAGVLIVSLNRGVKRPEQMCVSRATRNPSK